MNCDVDDTNEKTKEGCVEDALYKKAVGYLADEIIEEYISDEHGEVKLSKRKITKKHYSPDLSAAKILLSHYKNKESTYLDSLTEEELEKEKLRLIQLLAEEKDEET